MDENKDQPYEPPKLVSLGTVEELTLLDASGPNPDFAGFSPSLP